MSTSSVTTVLPLVQVATQHAAAIFAMRYRVARDDVNEFCELVMRDERKGQAIRQSPAHEEWARLAEKHDRLVIIGHVESGKTLDLAVARTIWLLGRDPSLRVVVVSNTWHQAVKIVRTVAGYIERSETVRAVFPALKPGRPWTPDGGSITVERSVHSKDPSLAGYGVAGDVLGSRIDHLVLDDVLDWENTRTPAGMNQMWERFHSTLLGRLTAKGRVIIVGNAYHYDDLLHRLEKNPRWVVRRFPAVDERGQPYWPEQWPPARVEAKRVELGPIEFARQMMCVPRDDATARFKKEWIDKCLARGAGRSMAYGMQVIPPGCQVYTGVDLAVSAKASADLTALVTILVHPNGDRELLCVESGRMSGPEIVERIVDHHTRYQSIIIVESNQAQAYILQFTSSVSAVPVRPFHTGANKTNPEFGVESLATEMSNGKWIIPSRNGKTLTTEVDALINELLFYDPAKHTGDRVMAMWFSREGARQGALKIEVGRVQWGRR